MSENILNIAKLNDEYPFLKNVWSTYNDFEKEVDDNKHSLYSLCTYFLKVENGDLNKYGDFCMKILRNLGVHSIDPQIYAPKLERCNLLYNWIYNSIAGNKITEQIVNECFKEYNTHMNGIKNNKRCYNFSNDKIYEPTKITLLDVFDNNTTIIRDALRSPIFSNSAPSRKYVCECVKIYKQMNDEYCFNEKGKRDDYSMTCLKLKQFKDVYDFFRRTLSDLHPSLPSVNDSVNDFLDRCPSERSSQVLIPEGVANLQGISGVRVLQDDGDDALALPKETSDPPVIVDSSMRKNITTTIGTLAGASSVLALLYRFTPAERLVNPRLRRIEGRTNNNFYSDRESELLFDEFAQGYINTYNIGYDAA